MKNAFLALLLLFVFSSFLTYANSDVIEVKEVKVNLELNNSEIELLLEPFEVLETTLSDVVMPRRCKVGFADM